MSRRSFLLGELRKTLSVAMEGGRSPRVRGEAHPRLEADPHGRPESVTSGWFSRNKRTKSTEPGIRLAGRRSRVRGIGEAAGRCKEQSWAGQNQAWTCGDFPGSLVVKNPSANVRTRVQSLVWEDSTCHRAPKPLCHIC